jgi:hypothetical protein
MYYMWYHGDQPFTQIWSILVSPTCWDWVLSLTYICRRRQIVKAVMW